MSYTRTTWIARVGTALNRFLKTNETSTEVELTNDPTGVTTAGTPFTVANMNKIETGIYDAHVTANANKTTLDNNVNQGVKTTDSPTFAGLKILTKSIKFMPTEIIPLSFSLPSSQGKGITFDGTNLISCDAYTDLIYIHDGISSTILSSFASPGAYPGDLAFDGTNLISCDAGTDMIYIHDGVTSTILSSFASPSTNPTGLTFDGTNLISCDTYTGLIYIHDGISATISSSFASPGPIPSGIAFDGVNLISCDGDSTTGFIYIHKGISETILSTLDSPALYPNGLTFDDTNLISCNSIARKIYVHSSNLYI